MQVIIGPVGYLHGMHCIELNAMQMKKLGDLATRRLICTVNATFSFPCAIQPRKEGRGFIMFSKQKMKQAGVISGDEATVTFAADTSEYGMPMSEELSEVLEQDPYGKSRFDKLTPGKQRNIIHFVGSVKSSHLRIERALKLIRNLSELPEGKENIREIFRN